MEPSKFKLDIEIEDGVWDITLQEGETQKTHATLTTQEVLTKIGDVLVDWTKQKK